MSTYFPFLRGKQSELLALRHLAERIAASTSVHPIIEPVNSNSTTRISFDVYADAGMQFLLISNPIHGEFKGKEQELFDTFVTNGALSEYDNYIPALYVNRDTTMREVDRFRLNFDVPFRAVVYAGEPVVNEVREWCSTDDRIYHHAILDGVVSAEFTEGIPLPRRILVRDNFRRRDRNADYPPTELFTDLNTAEGNPTQISWGDYSIQGDYYSDSGGPAYAVAIHHVHYSETGNALNISHFLSDRQETIADTPGKIIEAVEKLVAALDTLAPNDTNACDEYRAMAASGNSKGLPYLKRLSILHHLELMLANE